MGWFVPDAQGADTRDPIEAQWDECNAQIATALPFIRGRECVVQAGARVGLWPRQLAGKFARVLAFEPDPVNFECALSNLQGWPQVELELAALGRRFRYAQLMPSDQSGGEHYILPSPAAAKTKGSIRCEMHTIDDLELDVCDAIFLDVEGYEIEALAGAVQTLDRLHPTLICEENQLCTRYGYDKGKLERELKKYGYVLKQRFTTLPPEVQNDGRFRGADLIFA
jgi:FkbM family methyltransferase